MAPSASPKKAVPLALGDEPDPLANVAPAVTTRVFFCGVVVEGSEHGKRLPEGRLMSEVQIDEFLTCSQM